MHAMANSRAANNVRPARNGERGTVRPFDGPVNFATPLKVISSIIVGSERPLAFIANNIMR